jgi:hypothetical protein
MSLNLTPQRLAEIHAQLKQDMTDLRDGWQGTQAELNAAIDQLLTDAANAAQSESDAQ